MRNTAAANSGRGSTSSAAPTSTTPTPEGSADDSVGTGSSDSSSPTPAADTDPTPQGATRAINPTSTGGAVSPPGDAEVVNAGATEERPGPTPTSTQPPAETVTTGGVQGATASTTDTEGEATVTVVQETATGGPSHSGSPPVEVGAIGGTNAR